MKCTKLSNLNFKTMKISIYKTKSPRCDSFVDNSHMPPMIKDKSCQKVKECDEIGQKLVKKVTN